MDANDDSPGGWRDLLAEGRWPSFALICLGIWLMAADSLVTSTIMPSVGASLDGYAWFGWATSGYLVGVVVAGASAGWLADRIGLRVAMVSAGFVLAAGCAWSALAPDIIGFIAGRVVQGFGGGWVSGFCYVTISLVFPARHLVRVFAVATSIWGVATFIGPLIGGLYADAGDWRGVFWLFAAQAGLFALAAARLIPADGPRRRVGGLPIVQLILITLGITALAGAGLETEVTLGVALAAAGLGLLALAVFRDRRASVRLLPARAADLGGILGASYATFFVMTAASMGYGVYAPAILQFTNGLSATEAGYVVAAEALAWTVAALAVSNVGDKGRRALILVGTALVPLAATLLAFALASAMLPLVVLGGAMLGAGFGLSYSFISRLVMTNLDEAERATGSAAINSVRNAGGAAGAAIASIAANFAGFANGPSAANIGATGFWVSAVGVPLGIIGALAGIRLVRHAGSAADTRTTP